MSVHLDLDGAWPSEALPMPTLNLREWGPRLRYCTTAGRIDAFSRQIRMELPSFLLYGSGDFHHLSALWLRSVQEPFTLLSFDNHPDWDRRPPLWQCGAWINRALELPNLVRAQIWTPTSPDVAGFGRLMANRRALRSGRLQVFPYESNWLKTFTEEVMRLRGESIYVTVDMDCLSSENAVTNWDQGKVSAQEIAEALALLHAETKVIGGDLCGAWSEPIFERPLQRVASAIDHDRLVLPPPETIRKTNMEAFQIIWPALTPKY